MIALRFVNLISHLGQVETRHQPITAIAEKVGIPDWLVGIRHEATHARMPSLAILKPGASLAMEWLKTNYWSTEEKESHDLVWPESKRSTARLMQSKAKEATQTKLQDVPEELNTAVSNLLDLASEMQHVSSLHKVASENLRNYGLALWERKNPDATPKKKTMSAKHQIPLNQIRSLIMSEIDILCTEGDSNDLEAKGKKLVNALLGVPNFSSLSVDIFSQLFLLWKLLAQWKNLPKLMEKLAHQATEDPVSRKESLNLVSKLADVLLESKSSPKSSLKFDAFLASYDWSDIIHVILRDPDHETYVLFSKFVAISLYVIHVSNFNKL